MTRKIRSLNIRGLGYFPSAGMANLATELREANAAIAASDDQHGILGFEYVNNLTQACVAAHGSHRLLNVNGHSFGGNATLMIIQNLYNKKFSTEEIIVEYAAVIDPAMQSLCIAYPAVRYVYNPFQKVDPVGRGIVTAASGWTKRDIIIDGDLSHNGGRSVIKYTYVNGFEMTIENERRDMAHVSIDDDHYIHSKIVRADTALLTA